MNWYIDVLKKYTVFNGRARRKEFWMFILFNIIISIVLSFGEIALGGLIIMVVFTVQDSHIGKNQYGSNPKGF